MGVWRPFCYNAADRKIKDKINLMVAAKQYLNIPVENATPQQQTLIIRSVKIV
jgi:hypothetical protein